MNTRKFSPFLLIGALCCAIMGCNTPSGGTYSQSAPQAGQTTATSAMSAQDLDLSTVSDLIRSGRATDANSLQTLINDPAATINNVDLDKDGQVDPITVTEGQTANGKQFNLVANPATGEATTVATINLTTNAQQQVVVQAGYPAYVTGYQDYYYNYTVANNLAFMMWAMSPRPIWYPQPYRSYGWYHPWHTYDTGYVTQHRTTYSTQLHVSPVPRSAPPSDYVQRAQAQRTPSTFAKPAATPNTNNLNDRARARDFKVQDTSKPTQRATGFGATPKSTPSPAPRVSPPSSTPSPSRPSFNPPSRTPSPSVSPSRPSFGGGSSRPSGGRVSPGRRK